MKVHELIDRLKQFNPDNEVEFVNFSGRNIPEDGRESIDYVYYQIDGTVGLY